MKRDGITFLIMLVLLALNISLHWPFWLKVALIASAVVVLIEVGARVWKLVRHES